jgi:thymidylate kinase
MTQYKRVVKRSSSRTWFERTTTLRELDISPRADLWRRLIKRIDRELGERVVIAGAVPPDARDLDIIARPAERRVLGRLLASEGFLPRGRRVRPARTWVEQWVTFKGCEACPVDLDPAERWGLPAEELDDLFAEATPIDGYRNLSRPSPHHTLLLTARRFARENGRLGPKMRERIGRALIEAPDAWDRAEKLSSGWGTRVSLGSLWDAYEHGRRTSTLAVARSRLEVAVGCGDLPWKIDSLARRARTAVPVPAVAVAFSGLDGSGKSSQARALERSLETARVRVAVHWMPLGLNPSIKLVRRAVKWALLRVSRRARPGPSRSLVAGDRPALLPRENPFITQTWATLVALASASRYRVVLLRHWRRGGVVIFDRYALDSVAQLRYFYGADHRFQFQRWLVRTVTPAPLRAYLLDVAADTALARKPEQYDLQQLAGQAALLREECAGLAVRLDGDRPIGELCEQIAGDVWLAMRGGSGGEEDR